MSKEQLLHIFDESACLSRRQMKDYVNGSMTNEESHAVEVHLNACPFCNDAIEALFEQQEGNTADTIMALDGDFLRDHMGRNNPKIHLNSVAAAQTQIHGHRHKKNKENVTAFWRNTSIAAILLLAVGLLWFLKFGKDTRHTNRQIAQQTDVQAVPETATTQEPQATTDPDIAANPVSSENLPATKAVPAEQANPVSPNTGALPAQQPAVAIGNTGASTDALKSPADEKEKKAQEEIVVTQYKTPLVDKHELPAKAIAAEQIEKMPTRTVNSTAATAPDAYADNNRATTLSARSKDVSYTIDGVQTQSATSVTKENLDKAGALFEKGQYESALRVYKREFDSEDLGFKQKAIVMAAQCYSKLGNTAKAKELLQPIATDGGPQKKAARKLLKELEGK